MIERATSNAAKIFKYPEKVGVLEVGSIADVSVLDVVRGDFEFVDTRRQKRVGHQRFVREIITYARPVMGLAFADDGTDTSNRPPRPRCAATCDPQVHVNRIAKTNAARFIRDLLDWSACRSYTRPTVFS